MATPGDRSEEHTPPTTACPGWCIGHDADGPGGIGDHVHEAAPALVPCIGLERSTDGTCSIQRHPAAVELSLVRYQYRTGDDTWLYIGDGSRGLDVTLESAWRLLRVLEQYMAVAEEG